MNKVEAIGELKFLKVIETKTGGRLISSLLKTDEGTFPVKYWVNDNKLFVENDYVKLKGKIKQEMYEKEGKKHYSTVVVAEEMELADNKEPF